MGEIKIISGSWNTGKTRRMLQIYERLEKGTADGFVSIKTHDEAGDFMGYTLKQLSTGLIMPLAILKQKLNDQLEETFEFERFVFSGLTFKLASSLLDDLIKKESVRTIILDEIGQLELMDMGFADIFGRMIHSGKDLYVVVNEHFLPVITEKFQINGFETEYVADNYGQGDPEA